MIQVDQYHSAIMILQPAVIFCNNIVINGNLTVKGTSTTVESQNITVQDPLMVLSSGADPVLQIQV